MKFDLENSLEVQKAKTRFDYLVSQKAKIDLLKINPKRSTNQNSYLHVCITLFGIHVGLTIEEAKTHLKRSCGFMVYDKNGEKFLKMTSKMDSLELTEFIGWIRNYASDNGLYIPNSEEYYDNKFYFDREIESNKEYL